VRFFLLKYSKALIPDPKEYGLEKGEIHKGVEYDIERPYERWKELNADHRYLHIGFIRLKEVGKWGDWTKDRFAKYHARIVDTMRKMYFPYLSTSNELDRLSKKYEKTKPPKEDELEEWKKKRRKIFKAV
jgi:hypothetical protein